MTSFISQIVYPDDIYEIQEDSYLIGWNLEGFQCCVIGYIPVRIATLSSIQHALNQICNQESFQNIFRVCSRYGKAKPLLIGLWVTRVENITTYEEDERTLTQRQHSSIWITLTADSNSYHNFSYNNGTSGSGSLRRPTLLSLSSVGNAYQTSCYMIGFPRQRAGWADLFMYEHGDADVDTSSLVGNSCDSGMTTEPRFSGSDMQHLIAQLNSASDLMSALQCSLKRSGHSFRDDSNQATSRAGTYSVQALIRFVQCICSTILACTLNPLNGIWNLCTQNIFCVLLTLVGAWLKCIWFCRRVLDCQLASMINSFAACGKQFQPAGLPKRPHLIDFTVKLSEVEVINMSLSKVSFFCQHLSQRFVNYEMCFYRSLVFNHSLELPISTRRDLWIAVCSDLISITVDLLFGLIACYFLHVYNRHIHSWVDSVSERFEKRLLLRALSWFEHSPGGIQLSPLISKNLGSALKSIIKSIHKLYLHVSYTAAMEILINAVAIIGFIGVRAQLYLVIDILRLATLHIRFIHRVFAEFHRHQVLLICSLWQLFNGRKFNILRDRIDTCTYDRAQLLFGTALFAIATFLLPSFAVYYFFFSLCQLCILLIQAVLWGASVLLRDFPLYELGSILLYSYVFKKGVSLQVVNVACENNLLDGDASSLSPHSANTDVNHADGGEKKIFLNSFLRGFRPTASSTSVQSSAFKISDFSTSSGRLKISSVGRLNSPNGSQRGQSAGLNSHAPATSTGIMNRLHQSLSKSHMLSPLTKEMGESSSYKGNQSSNVSPSILAPTKGSSRSSTAALSPLLGKLSTFYSPKSRSRVSMRHRALAGLPLAAVDEDNDEDDDDDESDISTAMKKEVDEANTGVNSPVLNDSSSIVTDEKEAKADTEIDKLDAKRSVISWASDASILFSKSYSESNTTRSSSISPVTSGPVANKGYVVSSYMNLCDVCRSPSNVFCDAYLLNVNYFLHKSGLLRHLFQGVTLGFPAVDFLFLEACSILFLQSSSLFPRTTSHTSLSNTASNESAATGGKQLRSSDTSLYQYIESGRHSSGTRSPLSKDYLARSVSLSPNSPSSFRPNKFSVSPHASSSETLLQNSVSADFILSNAFRQELHYIDNHAYFRSLQSLHHRMWFTGTSQHDKAVSALNKVRSVDESDDEVGQIKDNIASGTSCGLNLNACNRSCKPHAIFSEGMDELPIHERKHRELTGSLLRRLILCLLLSLVFHVCGLFLFTQLLLRSAHTTSSNTRQSILPLRHTPIESITRHEPSVVLNSIPDAQSSFLNTIDTDTSHTLVTSNQHQSDSSNSNQLPESDGTDSSIVSSVESAVYSKRKKHRRPYTWLHEKVSALYKSHRHHKRSQSQSSIELSEKMSDIS